MKTDVKSKPQLFDSLEELKESSEQEHADKNSSAITLWWLNLKYETRILVVTASISAGVWLFDSLIDYLFFYDLSFWDTFLFAIPAPEVFTRIMIVFTFILFSLIFTNILLGYRDTQVNLKQINEELENRVLRRTEKFIKSNNKLQLETVERKRAQEKLKQKAEFNELVAGISSRMININSSDIEDEIKSALRWISEFKDIERAYTFEYTQGIGKIRELIEWHDEDVKSIEKLISETGGNYLSRFISGIMDREIYKVNSLSEIPEDGEDELLFAKMHELQSVLVLPVKFLGQTSRFIILESLVKEKKWSEDTINSLSIVSEIFINALERKSNEEALKKSEIKFRTLFEELPIGLYRTTASGKILEANDALVKILGFKSKKALLSSNVSKMYINPEDREEFCRILLEKEIIHEFEFPVKTKDGRTIIVQDTARLVKDEKNGLEYFEGNMRIVKSSEKSSSKINLTEFVN